ncbi:MAG TPA: FAD-binding oxidoreductase [Ornithinimicrobium sp.]|uniref:FAD-binding oxidoreductase n=1 Tax=Ornithinimicrobium sp. TaxID=1977084 RepID=UPI002B47B498|nr:FAD-binding oxidoreductase [Ornithinimicrobium sp.]HKJ11416.1 FAD-binding oxidoreductase [Ornithinimicrobium sp.]
MPSTQAHDRGDRVVRPAGLAETVDAVRTSAGSVLVRGAGTKQDWGGRVRDPELVLDTTGMDQVLTHNPADMTVSVQAGIPLRRLQEGVGAHGQWVALDPASARDGATVGGLLAAGDSGPSRQRYGGLRDLVIGVTLVLADGSVGRSGGHVIKNVAGYDLAKLVHGSLGSLAVIGEVVLRLHPIAPSLITVQAPAEARAATAAVLALAAGPCEPSRVAWAGGSAEEGRLMVAVEGTAAGAPAAAERVRSTLADARLDAEALSPEQAARAWSAHDADRNGTEGETVLAVNGLPSELATVAEKVHHNADQAGVSGALVSWAGVGMHVVRFGGGEPDQHVRAVRAMRQYADRAGCSTMLRRRPRQVDDLLEVMGTPPPSVGMLRALKNQFDPEHRLAPGRFGGWLGRDGTQPHGSGGGS